MPVDFEALRETETQLRGQWDNAGDAKTADRVWQRIDWLVDHRLEHVCTDASGADLLLQDPGDGRLWERLYLDANADGRGPPSLRLISPDRMKRKYPRFAEVRKR